MRTSLFELCCGKSREQRGTNVRVTLVAPEPAQPHGNGIAFHRPIGGLIKAS
jgi:hypothetical protein